MGERRSHYCLRRAVCETDKNKVERPLRLRKCLLLVVHPFVGAWQVCIHPLVCRFPNMAQVLICAFYKILKYRQIGENFVISFLKTVNKFKGEEQHHFYVHVQTCSLEGLPLPHPSVLTSSGGHRNTPRLASGRYASYWNVALLM